MKRHCLLLMMLICARTLLGQGAQTKQPSAAFAVERVAGSVFRDCPKCPEMLVIPGGSFNMGS